MLLELRVENLLLIDRAELRLGPGLNAVTGETGAGKTVLAHALDLLLGGKARSGIVRPGAGEAYVEGVFATPPGLLDDPDLAELRERLPDDAAQEIVLGRRVGADGRTRAFVGGRSGSAADLSELGSRLLSFYGQHEHRKLTIAGAQLDLLDGFAGTGQLARRAEFAAMHARVLGLERELDALTGRAGARDRDLDLLAFEIEEIEALDPSEAEQAALLAERGRLRHLDALRAAAGGAADALSADDSGAGIALAQAESLASGPAGADERLDALAARLSELRIEADDVAAELRGYLDGLEAEPGRLEQVEERLEAYDRLGRKHGGSVAAILAHAERCRTERDQLERGEVALEELEGALADARAERQRLAAALTKARRAAGPKLSKRVVEELAELSMQGASFAVELDPRDGFAGTGAERVEFMLSPNPGVAPSPLRETASGGELSRVMLALMGASATGGPPTLVFDEIDAGIGGHTARAVGERLRSLAGGRQVLCITHLPQIAALADSHFTIEKDTAATLASATVTQLEGPQVVDELCRMLGADSGDLGARQHAEALLA
jgi:DNA repair protein RecN (Recombination protein N)